MEASPYICPTCGNILAPNDLFCSRCGTKVFQKSQTVGLGRQIWIYFVSIFLPPLGLIWTWKYLRNPQASGQAKRVGWIALILTIVATIVTIWVTIGFLQGIQNQINSVSNFSNTLQ